MLLFSEVFVKFHLSLSSFILVINETIDQWQLGISGASDRVNLDGNNFAKVLPLNLQTGFMYIGI